MTTPVLSPAAAWTAPFRDLPSLRAARARLIAGERAALHGVGAPADLLAAVLLSEQPLLVVVPTDRDLEPAVEDLRTLAGELGQPGAVLAFPAPGPAPYRPLPRNPDAAQQRATVLQTAARGRLRAAVTSPSGLLRPTLAPRLFDTRVVSLAVGEELTPEILLEALDEGGYRREDPVTAPGMCARRGGILDFFPPDHERPVRVELFGDTIESLRTFDPDTQRTHAALERLEVVPLTDAFAPRSVLAELDRVLRARFDGHRDLVALRERIARGLAAEELAELIALVPGTVVPLWAHFPEHVLVVREPEAVRAESERFHIRAREEKTRREDALLPDPAEALVAEETLDARLLDRGVVELRELDTESRGEAVLARPSRRYGGDLRALVDHLSLRAGRSVLFLGTPGRAERVSDILQEGGLALGEQAPTEVRVGVLSRGFELPEAGLSVLADGDVFPEEVHLHPRGRKRGGTRSFLSDFRDLKVGDLVVHEDHGLGRFHGLETIEVGGLRRELMVLTYQGGDRLMVPVESFDRVQKYASAEGARPPVDKLGSGQWIKVKKRVKKAMRDMAAELLKLYAERKARPGHAFTAESPWLHEFEESFEYEETADQAAAIADVAHDMGSDSPMDRLICGDVGYGKTEVAMRATMRAVLDGKQVAVLTPTTVLAFQHWKTFKKRFAPFPVRIEMVSRFRTSKEIREVLAEVAEGKVDVLIGTHRLLSRDVAFKDLGLVIVDEEQRFGVAAKEKLKHLRTIVDCLTLSATPIPRTLQMGLASIRDMSVIETPPKDRLAIQTSIVKFSTDVIATAIRQELARDGQVYFVHNRVESIYSLANLVTKLVPEARVVVGHGQQPETELEKSMLAFVEGRADVLVATTIIENGLDIPRANTMLINRADRYGLAQLYQLRGRVGRSDRRAYAYLLVPPATVLSEIAKKRLAAIREFSDLGAGFRIAALDLELRGAGNLLGGQQSGHIEAVGLDLYIKLLEQSVQELRGQPVRESVRATLNLRLDLRIPAAFVPEVEQRMSLYKRVSQTRAPEEVETLRAEIRDRYGPLPAEVETLLRYAGARLRAEAIGVQQADLAPQSLLIRFVPEPALPPEGLLAFVRSRPGTSVSPEGVLRVPLASGADGVSALDALVGDLARQAV